MIKPSMFNEGEDNQVSAQQEEQAKAKSVADTAAEIADKQPEFDIFGTGLNGYRR